MEQYRDRLPAAETGRRATLNLGPFADRLLRFEPAAGAAVVSDLVDAHGCTVGPGALIYGNRLGGRVALVPWTAAAEPVLNVHRARWLREQIGHLAPGGGCGGVDGAPWLVPQFLSDGERGRGVVWNLSPDAVTAFNLETPAGMPLPRVAVQVAADASRRPARVDGGRVTLDQPLQQWEFVVLS
jgi:hypothetical protein